MCWDCKFHGSIHLYGHIHNNENDTKLMENVPNAYNVGVDTNNFKPILLDNLLNKI